MYCCLTNCTVVKPSFRDERVVDPWFVDCDFCGSLTSSYISFIIFTRNDYEQVTRPLCKYCRYRMYSTKLEIISRIKVTPHKNLYLTRILR